MEKKSKRLEELFEKIRNRNKNEDLNNIFKEIREIVEPEPLQIITANINSINTTKTVLIRRFGHNIEQFSLTSKENFDNILRKHLLFPLFKENEKLVPLRSFSQIKKSKDNPVIIEEGIDINNFDKSKFETIIYYLGREADEGEYLYDYKYLTLNYLLYFPFLINDNRFNKVYNNGTYISQINEECSKFEVLVRKFFLYGKITYKFFIGPNKIGKTSLIHQIIHHNFLHEKDFPYIGYYYIDLSLFFNKVLNKNDVTTLFNDAYFMFFNHNDFISFIKDCSIYINSDSLCNIFKIIKNIIKYIFKKYEDKDTNITIILDHIKGQMKKEIYDLITFSEELCRKKNIFSPKIKLLFCGDFNFGEIFSQKITYLINSNANLDEESDCHIIFDSPYKIPRSTLATSEKNILEQLNYELSSFHDYNKIISKDISELQKYELIKQKIKEDLIKYDNNYLFLSKLLIEKCKILENNENEDEFRYENEDEIRYLIDKEQENNILKHLPWAFFRITKNDNNITGYNIIYKDNIAKNAIEEINNTILTKANFIEYEQNRPNNIFGYFFEQFLSNKFKNSMKFFNYEIDDILIVNSIYTNNYWDFIKKTQISKYKCYLILQDLINAPYYDIAILIPKEENFIILLIQITVSKNSNKRELLGLEYNYQRFLKIKYAFENAFKPFVLCDADFAFLLLEKRDMDTVYFCIKNCIKCISYFKNDNFYFWEDDSNLKIIDIYPLDEFTLLNSMNNNNLNLRKEKIKNEENKKLLNLFNINPRTKKLKPLINITQKEKEIISSKIKENLIDINMITDIILSFIENEKGTNIKPIGNEVIVYLQYNNLKYTKIGFAFSLNDKTKYFNFFGQEFLTKFEGDSHILKYEFKYKTKLIGQKRNHTK